MQKSNVNASEGKNDNMNVPFRSLRKLLRTSDYGHQNLNWSELGSPAQRGCGIDIHEVMTSATPADSARKVCSLTHGKNSALKFFMSCRPSRIIAALELLPHLEDNQLN